MWFLYCLVFCYPQSCQYLIVAMELLCTQATNWSPCWNGPETQQMVQGLGWTASRLQGKSHWSVVGWERDPAGSGGIDHLGCIFSDLCTHIWKQEASSAVLLVQDIDSTADKLGGFFFFSSFPSQSFGELRAARGEGKYLEGLWGHLGRTNSCLAGHREKQHVLRSRRRETQGPCGGEQSVKSSLGGEERRLCQLLPFH